MAPSKNRKPVNSGNKSKTRQPRKLTLEELLQAAEHALTTQDPRHAIALYTAALPKAVESWQQQVEVLEKRAEVHVSPQNQDDALRDYQVALSLVPDPAPSTPEYSSASASLPSCSEVNVEQLVEILERKAALCMYIGQLSTDVDALKYYSTGIEYLKSLLGLQEQSAGTADPSITKHETKRQLAVAYCAVAELYLTDLCFEENAESACESFLNQALALDDKCPDTLQALCSLRLSQSRGREAAPIILQIFSTMQVGCSALSSLVGLREDDSSNTGATELLELQEVQDLPGFEFRCQTAKLLLECAAALTEEDEHQKSQCVKAAIDVLGSLLAENDEVVEIWILVGDAFVMGEANDEQKELCCHYWERALHMLTEVQKSLVEEQQEASNMEEEDALQQQLDGVVCQMEELRIKIEEARADDAMEE